MYLPAELLQFLGSLVAIFALAGLAFWLKLGGSPELANDADARAAANEAVDGYVPSKTAIDAKGRGAIMSDSSGLLLILKPHGNKFAGRILTGHASASTIDGVLVVDSGERRYGSVELELEEAGTWASAINRLHSDADA